MKRKCDTEGFVKAYKDDLVVRDWVGGYFTIPLLPPEKCKDGWEWVSMQLDRVRAVVSDDLKPKVEKIHKYYKKFWLRSVGPQRLSVYNQYHRTNNRLTRYMTSIYNVLI